VVLGEREGGGIGSERMSKSSRWIDLASQEMADLIARS